MNFEHGDQPYFEYFPSVHESKTKKCVQRIFRAYNQPPYAPIF